MNRPLFVHQALLSHVTLLMAWEAVSLFEVLSMLLRHELLEWYGIGGIDIHGDDVHG